MLVIALPRKVTAPTACTEVNAVGPTVCCIVTAYYAAITNGFPAVGA